MKSSQAAEMGQKLLSQVQVKDYKENSAVTILKSTDSVNYALQTLQRHRILSAPVVEEGEGEGDNVIGFLDIKDIIRSFIQETSTIGLEDMKMLRRMAHLEDKGAEFSEKKINELPLFGSDGTFLHTAQQTMTMLQLVQERFLSQAPRKVGDTTEVSRFPHRVAIFNEDKKVSALVSQTDLIRYINSVKDQLGDALNSTVADLGIGSTPVVSVTPDTPALECFSKLTQTQVQGIAVVNDEGAMIGSFSSSDMRSFAVEHFGALALPVGEFLALEHGTEFGEYAIHSATGEEKAEEEMSSTFKPAIDFATNTQRRMRKSTLESEVPGHDVGQQLVLATSSSTLGEVIGKLVDYRVHRLYVVDDKLSPQNVISLTDILLLLTGS